MTKPYRGMTRPGSRRRIRELTSSERKTKYCRDDVYYEFKTLVIVGEYGVGKTALCKMIFNNIDVKRVYAPRIWVSMHSQETEGGEDKKISVLKRILELKMTWETDAETATEKELSALLYALHLDLRFKKYLIVFDDVREEDDWKEILEDDEEKLKEDERWGKYLSDGFHKGSGGRVIYTTRDEKKNLANKLVAKEHEIHRLWPLTDPKSVWDIYEAAVTENGIKEPPRNDKKCIDELMSKSRGLPLAARMIAKLESVFLDDETVPQKGTTYGTTASANQPTSE
ncbi:unnamed protein product [Arabis nemorensis]|uniref:NB-ARC domain-containing protein n=1 Tax=Arabis nemorensis TaxID=586526 RepID=A0A565C316_9BRAS|nr:unnamed protein product [Arabis nemorensis]